MSKKAQNFFLLFGLAVLGVMVSQLDFQEAWHGMCHAGYWFVAVVVLWAFLYIFNASAWYIIIRSDGSPETRKLSFSYIYRLTVSGFALNYATPGGLMGGEPYRIMSISPFIGKEKASSSVILYAMTHMFSHFWFWAISIILFLVTQTLTTNLAILLTLCTGFCILGLWFFMAGYRKGLANRVLSVARHIPILKKWARPFVESHKEQLDTIDSQISALHAQNPRTFLLVLMPEVSFIQCILVLAFTSLFANLLFFIPLQLGGREGGFLMSITAFGISSGSAAFVALLVRLRELIWTAIGLALIKFSGK